jgi:hypothetical protein
MLEVLFQLAEANAFRDAQLKYIEQAESQRVAITPAANPPATQLDRPQIRTCAIQQDHRYQSSTIQQDHRRLQLTTRRRETLQSHTILLHLRRHLSTRARWTGDLRIRKSASTLVTLGAKVEPWNVNLKTTAGQDVIWTSPYVSVRSAAGTQSGLIGNGKTVPTVLFERD